MAVRVHLYSNAPNDYFSASYLKRCAALPLGVSVAKAWLNLMTIGGGANALIDIAMKAAAPQRIMFFGFNFCLLLVKATLNK